MESVDPKSSINITFSEFFYKAAPVVGSCSSWNDFYKFDLSLPFDDLYFSSISASLGYSDTEYKSPHSLTTTCTDRAVINGIVNSLNNNGDFRGTCNGTFPPLLCVFNRNKILI